MQVKGNVYKNKRVLMEAIHHMKAEKLREKTLADQLEARRAKNKVIRQAKLARREERLNAVRSTIYLFVMFEIAATWPEPHDCPRGVSDAWMAGAAALSENDTRLKHVCAIMQLASIWCSDVYLA